jgi:peptide/nickel transport system substrate-binding protein
MNQHPSQPNDRRSPVVGRALSRRRLLQSAAGLAAGATLARLPHRVAAQGTKGGTLVIARADDAQSLDPTQSGSFNSGDTMALIYDTLTALDMDGSVVPNLAQSWQISPDGKSYTFKLRQGITFHDGTTLDAAAVKAHFDRTIDPKTGGRSASWIDQLQSTQVVDPQTVTMTLKNPWAPLLATLTVSAFGIPSPTAVQAQGQNFGQNPVGSGPFKFKEWVPGDHITLVKNPNYQCFLPYVTNKGAPYLDQVIWRDIPEAQTQVAALEAARSNSSTWRRSTSRTSSIGPASRPIRSRRRER